uniref:Uncharacterized protein n=1 Tax=Avena sativa TaxID=4498 RepID=A0ACD5XBE1_AVESA
MGGSDSKEAELIPVRLLQSRKYLQIEPNVLHFSFETEEQTSCSMQMTNITDYHVGFQVNGPTCFGKYTVQPNVGSVPPRCTVHVILTMQTQKETVPDMQCKDTCLVQSIVVREGTSDDDIRMHIEFKRYLLDEVKLKVVYVPPQFDSDSNKLLEIEPNQLHFSGLH